MAGDVSPVAMFMIDMIITEVISLAKRKVLNGLEWMEKNKLIEISKVWYVDLGMDHSRGSGTSG